MTFNTTARRYPAPNVRGGRRVSPPKGASRRGEGLDGAIARAQAHLLAVQHDEGFWWGELESNPTMEAEYIFVTHFLDAADQIRWRKIANHILGLQQQDGGWNLYYGAPGDLSTSCECYLALKMAGVDARDPAMRRARSFILSKGGVERARVFTKIWLALLGEWDWKGTPYLAPELMLIPNKLPFSIYQFAMWSRATIVPMSILLCLRPARPVPASAGIDELFVNGRARADYSLPRPSGLSVERLMYAADRLLRIADKIPINPARRLAIKEAERWILAHQEEDGSWGGIQPPWVYSLMALNALGYSTEHEAIRRGLEGFERYAIETEDTWRLQASMSPLWDTCLSMIALLDSGIGQDHPAVVRAAEWLVDRQVLAPGDWQVRTRNVEPGGWAFEFHNQTYPDIDDAAVILMAIARAAVADTARRDAAVRRGVRWALGLQSRNGGWGAYDKDNTSTLVTRLPFFDFGETIDPPSADVTAHVLEMLAALGQPLDTPAVEKAMAYLWGEQEEDGCWFGRWGVNYVYGTGAVLPALVAAGVDPSDPRLQAAADWLVEHQNPDGGWGESCASYANPAFRGRGPTTASQTAWALLALVAAGRSRSASARRGVDYLVAAQRADGSWEEAQYTGTGFPGYGIGERRFRSPDGRGEEPLSEELPAGFMIKYHMYRIYWPLMALGRYRANLTQ